MSEGAMNAQHLAKLADVYRKCEEWCDNGSYSTADAIDLICEVVMPTIEAILEAEGVSLQHLTAASEVAGPPRGEPTP